MLNCKLCNSEVKFFGSVDFGRTNNKNLYPLGKSNINVSYYKCCKCNLLSSYDFDNVDSHFWKDKIYNNDYYSVVDKDYKFLRPYNQSFVIKNLYKILNKSTILDYGGGDGATSKYLNKYHIYPDIYDPFSNVQEYSKRPANLYSFVMAFEVLEHDVNPIHLFSEINDLLDGDGIFLATTALLGNKNINWPYIAPRNGHFTIYSSNAFKFIIDKFKFSYFCFLNHHFFSKNKILFSTKLKIIFIIFISKIINRYNKIFYIKNE